MSQETPLTPRDPWVVRSVVAVAAVFVASLVVGFMVLPLVQPIARASDLWDAICSAAGVVRGPSSAKPIEPDFKVSSAVMTSDMLRGADAESIGRGATLAHECAICHGPTGVSRADSPNLAGQYASAICKELKDFQTGARVNAVMSPFAAHMSDQDMIDLASYYAYLPRLPAYHPVAAVPLPRIVINGAPLRNIAPCGSCHGALDNKVGSPWLEGQSAVYIKSQLEAFASGERRNDISEQMRNIARRMTPEEIDEAAQYYASQPTPDVRPAAR
jgi:cytochrome c553